VPIVIDGLIVPDILEPTSETTAPTAFTPNTLMRKNRVIENLFAMG